jgi:hypothetical protein
MGNRGPERNVVSLIIPIKLIKEAPIEVENPGMNQVRSQRYHEAVLNRYTFGNKAK